MKIKASIVVISHLSDAQEYNANGIGIGAAFLKSDIDEHINFAKYIILQCNGDLNQDIDADEMWEKYQNR